MIKSSLLFAFLVASCLQSAHSAQTADETRRTARVAGEIEQALARYEHRDFDSAIEILRPLAEEGNPHGLLHLTRMQMRSGRAKEAVATAERFIAAFPDNADAHYVYGLANLTMMSEVSMFRFVSFAKKASGGWAKAVELDPGHLDGQYALFSYYVNAPKIGGGDIEKAEQKQQVIAGLDRGYGLLAESVLLVKAERFVEAEAKLIEATRVMDTAGAYFGQAQFYLQQEEWTKALAAIENFFIKPARLWDPDITAGYLLTARGQAGLDDGDAARAAIAKGLSLKPNKRVKGLLEETRKDLTP